MSVLELAVLIVVASLTLGSVGSVAPSGWVGQASDDLLAQSEGQAVNFALMACGENC